jgi:hypothetical protein
MEKAGAGADRQRDSPHQAGKTAILQIERTQ